MVKTSKVSYKTYKCRNCGNEQKIQTNHFDSCIDYCQECSWKPSFGAKENAIPFNGRTYRPFDCAEVEPGAEKPLPLCPLRVSSHFPHYLIFP